QLDSPFLSEGDDVSQPQSPGRAGAEDRDGLPGQRDAVHQLLELEQRGREGTQDRLETLFFPQGMFWVEKYTRA
ncbi:MAG: hypothetical protein ACWGQW_21490, partial [bacterium]